MNKLLFIAFNRRYDSQFMQLKEDLANKIYGNPLYFVVICRDYPFPPKKYLETCGGLIRDCVVHDLDALCFVMNTKIKEINAHVMENEETSYINLVLENGTLGTLVHSRHSETYDQRVNVFCETGTLQIKNATFKNKISFSERYRESYINQMREFLNKILINNIKPNIELEHAIHIEEVLEVNSEVPKKKAVSNKPWEERLNDTLVSLKRTL